MQTLQSELTDDDTVVESPWASPNWTTGMGQLLVWQVRLSGGTDAK